MNKENKLRELIFHLLGIFLIFLLFGLVVFLLKYNHFFTFFIALYVLNMMTNVWIFSQWRHLEAKISWMLVLSLLPIIGHIFYFLFGQKYSKAQTRKQYFETYNQFFINEQRTNNKLLKDNEGVILATEHLSQRKFKDVNFEMIADGHTFFEQIFDKLKKAKKFIHIEIYIIKKGEIWDELAQILINKASEGIEVRIIVDGFGVLDLSKKDLDILKKAGIEIVQYGKINFPFVNSNLFYRTHKKMIIIDGQHLFSGGNNISDEYVSFSSKYGVWLDANFYATGATVQDYAVSFIYSWHLHTDKNLDLKKYAPIIEASSRSKSIALVIEDGPHSEEQTLEQFLLTMIFKSKKKIKLTTPYFVPTEKVYSALKIALISGVEVEIYVPGKYDKNYVFVSTLYFLKRLQAYGLKVYFLNSVFLHSKIAVFDDEYAYIGTMNLDIRSLYSQFEIVSLVHGDAVTQLNNCIKTYKQNSLDWQNYKPAHKKKNIMMSFAIQLFKPLL